MLSLVLLLIFVFLAFRLAPRERDEAGHVHGAGQIGLLAALALFGVDYFTSYYYATGEMMSALHPYGLQDKAYLAVAVIAFANFAFGLLYMFSLGPFNEGGGSYTASLRYLWPTLSLIVAVALIQDYVLTIVVSALSGGDQLLSILGLYGKNWLYHFAIGAVLASVTWYLTIRGRGESAKVVFAVITVFALLTVTMAIGLFLAHFRGVPPVPAESAPRAATLGQASLHMLTAAMKGMVALTGLEAVSNGIQFMRDEDAGIVKWGRRRLPGLRWLWSFFSGKSGVGRFVQTSFLFYGGLTTFFLTVFAIRFDVFDGTFGRTLVGNLAFIGFGEIPGGLILFWAYQIVAVMMLAAASMTALQDAQATEWRDVAMGGIPEAIIYRDRRGTFTRSVTITFALAVLIMFLVRGRTTVAVPFYGVGVFMPITAMGLAVRKHVLSHYTGRVRRWGTAGATFVSILAGTVFIGQLIGKWEEGGWIALLGFGVLALIAHTVLLSPFGYREPKQIYRIVREKARVHGAMASIVEWQAFRMQEYRYRLMIAIASFLELFGVGQQARRVPAFALANGGRLVPQAFAARAEPRRKRAVAGPVHPVETPVGLVDEPAPPRITRHRIILPINAVHQGTLTALRYATSLSNDVTAVHVAIDQADADALHKEWDRRGDGIRLVVLPANHGMVLEPLLKYIVEMMEIRQPHESMTIVVPQSVRPRWWSNLMRTQMASLLRLSLPLETGVVITDVPYKLDGDRD